MRIADVENIQGRRLLHLDGGRLRVWPCEVHLFDAAVERFHRRDVALTAKVAAMKEERRAEKKRKGRAK
jgi:hypothetical protein